VAGDYNEPVLARCLAFSPDHDADFFAALPAAAAVFALRGEGDPYVSKTANLRRRMQRLLGVPTEHSKRLNLRDRVRSIEFTPAGSDFESQLLLYQLLRETFPATYAARLRLHPAPLIRLHLENEYPRASVTIRLGRTSWSAPSPVHSSDSPPLPSAAAGPCDEAKQHSEALSSLYYGPFRSRAAAEKFASDSLDFFRMRRCVDDLQPDPLFPGCVYSEMKMCLAPCFKGCSQADYHAEVARVQAFFDTAGESLSRELSRQREQAAGELAFEQAASIHARLEKLKPVLAQLPEIVRRLDRLEAVILQSSALPDSVCLFLFHRCRIIGPMAFTITAHSAPDLDAASSSGSHARPRTLESRVQAALDRLAGEGPAEPSRSGSPRHSTPPDSAPAEHLSLLARWYYRSQRAGDIFFADERGGGWPLRRIVRAIGRLLSPVREQSAPTG
jgi:excinuclease ABC subunit C